MGSEEPSSSSSPFLGATVVPAPLSAAHFEPTSSLRRASLSAAAQLSLRSPVAAEPKSAPSTPVADQRPRDQRQQQPTAGQGPGYFALVLNTANTVANAFNLKPPCDSPTNSNANSGTSTGPNTTKYVMKTIADKRPATVTVSLDDVTGKTGVGGDGEIDVDGNVTSSSPTSAEMLKLQLPESQHATDIPTSSRRIDTDASTYFETTAPMDVDCRRRSVNVSKNRPLVSKSQSAVELQSYNELATPIAKSYSSISNFGDFEKIKDGSRVRTPSQSGGDSKFQTFPYSKRDATGALGAYSSSTSPGPHTMPRATKGQRRVDTSLPAARSSDREVTDAPVTGSESSANEFSVASGDISTSPQRSGTIQLSSSSGSGGNTTEEAALSLSSSLSGSAKKKNAEFHTRFKSVPAEEMLIDEFICALAREILVQGKLYVTEHHVCFYANVFGWVTQLVIAFQEIANIEKKVFLLFPNAIQIETLHSKHFFASFLSRDVAYTKLMECWNSSHSILLSSTAAYEPLPLEKSSSFSSESIIEDEYTSNGHSENTRENESGEERDSEETASDSEESQSIAENQEKGNTIDIRSITIPPSSTPSEAGAVPNTSASSDTSSDDHDDGSFLPTSSGNARSNARKRRPRHRGLLSRRAGSNGALSMLAASTLGSIVYDTAAAAAAASGKRRRAQTDINTRRREEAVEARRKVTKEKSIGSTQPSMSETPPVELVPEKKTVKSDPNLTSATAPPPPATTVKHTPSTCLCLASGHGPERLLLLDKVYSAPPLKVFTMVYDGGLRASDDRFSKIFMKAEGDMENLEVGKWTEVSKKGEVKAERHITYGKPQSNPLGPKSVTCNVVEEMLVDDPERCFTVRSTVLTPNVPSGNSFAVKIVTCFTWAENEQCRMQVNFWMDWTAKPWIKGMIEAKVIEGNKKHYELLDTELQKYISKHASEMYDVQPSADSSTAKHIPLKSKKTSSNRDGGKNPDGTASRKEGRTSTKQRKSRRVSSAAVSTGPTFLSDPMGYLLSPFNITQIVIAVIFVVIFLSQTYVWVRLSHLSARIREREEVAVAGVRGTVQVDTVRAWRPTVRPFGTVRDRQDPGQDLSREWAPTKEEMDAFWDWLADVEGGNNANKARSKGCGGTASAEKNTSDEHHPTSSPASRQKLHMHEMSKLAVATEKHLKRILDYVEKEMKGGGSGGTHDEEREPERREDVPGSGTVER